MMSPLLVSLLLLPPLLSAAAPASAEVPVPPRADSTDTAPSPSWLLPVGGVLGANAGLWAYNRWIADYGFARISASTVADNFRTGWVWDEDQFSINQFGHPYQGSFYYSAARVSGHGFYVATGYTMLGSVQWEYFMESEAPSYNDLVTTTLGGAMLGEVSYRLSEALVDPRAAGVERVARELGTAALNPVNGIRRLATGETFRVAARPREAHGSSGPPDTPLRVRVSTGGVLPYFSTAEGAERTARQRLPRGNTELLAIHGDPFAARAPYDYFLVNFGINLLDDPVSTVSARAQLHGVEIYRTARQRGLLMLGQNFDYLDNGIYKLGVSGLGGGYAHRRRWGHDWFHTLHIQFGVIPLGGVSSEFFRASLRDYNLGAGAYSHTRVTLGRHDVWFAALVGDRYWLRTRSGAKGDELIGHGRVELSRAVWKSLGLALSLGAYDRTARTRDHGTRTELTQEARLLLTWGML